MLLKDILNGFEYRVECSGEHGTDTEITSLAYDSRKATKGGVFVCLKGANSDGHKFVQQAIDSGAAVIVAQEKVECKGAVLILTSDTRRALAFMSCAYFGNPSRELTTIAVTGTKGKTTTTGMIRSILEEGGIKTGTIGTLGIVIGDEITKTDNTTPESYEIQKAMRKMVDCGCKALVIEASSLGFKWHRTDGFVFDYGVFTNFSHDHIGGAEHADLEEYLECKAMLFKQCRHGIVNIDDEKCSDILKNHTCTVETFGFKEEADIHAISSELVRKPGVLGVHVEIRGDVTLSCDVGVPGKFNAYNALAAVSVCRHFDITDENIISGLEKVKVKGRVEPVETGNNYTLLIDYAHNAVSMENVLSTLREYNPTRLITMFGAGGNRPKVRRYEMGEVSGRMSDLSVITEDNSRFEDVMDIINDIITGMSKTDGKYVVIPNRKDAIRYCMENAQDGDIIVLAGKGHEDYQETKGVKYHLDEREVIRDILAEKNN